MHKYRINRSLTFVFSLTLMSLYAVFSLGFFACSRLYAIVPSFIIVILSGHFLSTHVLVISMDCNAAILKFLWENGLFVWMKAQIWSVRSVYTACSIPAVPVFSTPVAFYLCSDDLAEGPIVDKNCGSAQMKSGMDSLFTLQISSKSNLVLSTCANFTQAVPKICCSVKWA